jgi:hypothetical protein
MPTTADAPYRQLLAALWVLLRTASTGGESLPMAASECWRCLGEVLLGGTHFVLQERNGALYANGRRIRPDVASFAAIAGITALLQDNDVSELLLLPEVTADDLQTMAHCWQVAGARTDFEQVLRQRGCIGIHVAHGRDGLSPIDPVAEPAIASAPSQLGAVFTMQRFAAALGATGPLGDQRARAVLQTVLHRLLRSPDNLEALERIQRDPVAHGEGVRACVLAVRTAEELGWDDQRSTAAGVAALLGPAAASHGDAEVAELARASAAVAALIGVSDGPDQAVERLHLHGQLPAFVGRAMEQALTLPPE